jgi:hypothetical protein
VNKIKIIANKTTITARVMQSILLLLIGLSVASCSTYPSKFKCGDAKGLGCTMLREVDKQIDSGKIAEAYNDKKRCSGSNCSSLEGEAQLSLKSIDKAKSYKSEKKSNKNQLSIDNDDPSGILDDDDNLYF